MRKGPLTQPLLRPFPPELLQSKSKPDRYFVPPYVGHSGWLGVRLDHKPDWAQVEEVAVDAYLTVAPKRLTDQLPDRLDI